MNQKSIYKVSNTEKGDEALVLADFCFPWKSDPVPETLFKAWHDGKRLFFVFEVRDDDFVLDDKGSDDEKVLGSDRVELFFSPTEDLSQWYYGFEMDPRGLVFQYRAKYHRQFDPDWQFDGLQTSGFIEGNRYKVEGEFDLDRLRDLNCLKGNEMIAGVYRGEFSHSADGSVQQDWISWIDPKTETADFHIPQTFGRFIFE